MNLTHVQEGTEHIVKAIVTDDEEMDAFLDAVKEIIQAS